MASELQLVLVGEHLDSGSWQRTVDLLAIEHHPLIGDAVLLDLALCQQSLERTA